MKKDRLDLPNGYVADYGLTHYHLSLYFKKMEQVKEHIDKGVNCYLSFPLKVIYNKRWYFVAIVRNPDNTLNWCIKQRNNNFKINTDEEQEDSLYNVIEYIIKMNE